MTVGLALTVGLAVLTGVSLGLLGGGGSILAVPLLVYVAGQPARPAIATSLLVVGVTSTVALLPHARAGRIRWRTGGVFGLAGMAGAYAGGWLARFVPPPVLLTAFALMMLGTAVAMLVGRPGGDGPAGRQLPVLRALAVGAGVGLVSGLVGAGGGFLVVPALTLLGGLPMPVAVGTSLAVIAVQTLAGFAGHLGDVTLDWPLALAVTGAAVAGSLVGGRLVGRVPPAVLRRTFGGLVLIVGLVMLGQQLPAAARPAVTLAAAVLVAAAAVAGVVLVPRRRRRSAGGGRSAGGTGSPAGAAGSVAGRLVRSPGRDSPGRDRGRDRSIR